MLPLDLTCSETFPATTTRVLELCGRVDILVNNGGVSGARALAADATLAVERATDGGELLQRRPDEGRAAVHAARVGHIVVVSSVMGYVGTPGRSTYAAAKHALHGYFDSLRAEVWREGLKVTLACPGYVQTAVSANALDAQGGKHGRTDPTHQRGITAEKCAAAIVRAVARGREEIAMGGPEVFAIQLKRFFPWLASRIVRRMKFVAK